jgi:hypothetical protein
MPSIANRRRATRNGPCHLSFSLSATRRNLILPRLSFRQSAASTPRLPRFVSTRSCSSFWRSGSETAVSRDTGSNPYAPFYSAWLGRSGSTMRYGCVVDAGNVRRVQTPVQTSRWGSSVRQVEAPRKTEVTSGESTLAQATVVTAGHGSYRLPTWGQVATSRASSLDRQVREWRYFRSAGETPDRAARRARCPDCGLWRRVR